MDSDIKPLSLAGPGEASKKEKEAGDLKNEEGKGGEGKAGSGGSDGGKKPGGGGGDVGGGEGAFSAETKFFELGKKKEEKMN